MYKRIKRHKLGRTKSHRDSLRRNLLRSLFDNTYVVTTTTKAKVLKQDAMSLIEKGKKKKEDLSFRRELQVILGNNKLVKKYQEYVIKTNTGVGLIRVGFRDGDNAELARVYLLGIEKKKTKVSEKEEKEVKQEEKEEKKKQQVSKPSVDVPKDTKIDKSAEVKRTTRARARAGI